MWRRTVPADAADEVGAQVVEMCVPEFADNGAVYKYAASGLFRQEYYLLR
jgi:hypothetical protein